MADFGSRLTAVIADRGPLCLGIDPHPFLLEAWGLDDDEVGLREFSLRCLDAAVTRVGLVKPQVAFFERHGAAGFRVLEELLGLARAAGTIVIADAKRGDIGSTVDAYGEAWLQPGSPLEADAMTVVAYQGVGSIAPVVERALSADKGLFVLAATSNPEARAVQLARDETGRSVASVVVDDVAAIGSVDVGSVGVGSVGVVIGATVSASDYGIDEAALSRIPVLAPGFGEQGARLGQLRALFPTAPAVVANVGRSVLRAGADGLGAALDDAVREAGGTS